VTDPASVFPDEAAPRHDVPKGGRSGFTVVTGRQVHYLEWGRSGAPEVLCLHGGGQTAYMFEDLGSRIGDRYHVLGPDLPAHGDSDDVTPDTVDNSNLADDAWVDMPEPPGIAYGPVVFAATLPPLMDQFGLTSVDLVGASLGGMISLILAAYRPNLVRSITLIDVGHQLEPEGVRKIIDFMRAHESFGSLEEAAAEIARYLPQRKNVRPESLTRNLRQRSDGRWVWKHGYGRRFRELDAGGVEEQHPAENLDVMMAVVRRAAERVHCPVLVLRGAESDVLSDEGAQAAVDLIPNARLEIVEKAGHLAVGDNPHSSANLIAAWLDEHGR
jgi:pimeloyl-ACP methyl ester carboxylesterase